MWSANSKLMVHTANGLAKGWRHGYLPRRLKPPHSSPNSAESARLKVTADWTSSSRDWTKACVLASIHLPRESVKRKCSLAPLIYHVSSNGMVRRCERLLSSRAVGLIIIVIHSKMMRKIVKVVWIPYKLTGDLAGSTSLLYGKWRETAAGWTAVAAGWLYQPRRFNRGLAGWGQAVCVPTPNLTPSHVNGRRLNFDFVKAVISYWQQIKLVRKSIHTIAWRGESKHDRILRAIRRDPIHCTEPQRQNLLALDTLRLELPLRCCNECWEVIPSTPVTTE